jgi:hypothetical protein
MDHPMNKREADYEAWRFGDTGFKYPGDLSYTELERDARLSKAIVDAYELESARAAMQFARNMMAWSRTAKAGRLRMMAAENLTFGEPSVEEIAFRMDVSKRRVWQVIREVRCHCEPLLKFHSRRRRKFPRIKKF